MGYLVSRGQFTLAVLLILGHRLFFALMRMIVAGRGHLQEDQGEQGKDQGLHERDKDLQRDKDDIGEAHRQVAKDRQHRAPGEDIAKETEGKREQARELRDDFDETYKELDWTRDAVRE